MKIDQPFLDIAPATPSAIPLAAKKKTDDPARIHEAAQQFEGFLISQIMKTMSSSGSFLGTEDDQAGSTAIDMAEEQFAKALSSRGGLGLAKMVEAGLQSSSAKPPVNPTAQKLAE
jgi:Rod binding domain-containing protein